MKRVTFKSLGNKLVGTIIGHSEKTKKPAILFVSGWKSKREGYSQYAQALVDKGFLCMTFDLAGHGESGGDINVVSRERYVGNCLDAYDYISKLEGVNPDSIGIVGSSFGGYLAAILVNERKVNNLVLTVVQNYPDKGFEKPKVLLQGDKLKDWREEKLDYKSTKSLKGLHSFDGRVLIIQSEFDKWVTDQTIKNYINAVKDKKLLTHVFLKGFPHSLREKSHRRRYEEILVEWLSQKEN